MNERQILQALRDRDPRGVTAVYDRFAEGLYDYCWWLLRDHGSAREALHDALLAAGVHADALRHPERLQAWLYALVRAECLRRGPATPRTEDDATAPDSGELRSLAWQATEAIPAAESDALQLHVRHGIEIADLALLLDRPAGEVESLVSGARIHVGQALRSEMLAATGPTDCSELSALLADPDGANSYERVDRHARGCPVCSDRVPRRVSVSRLMGLLPTVAPPGDLRQRVIDAYAEPGLLEYRLLAARRLQPLARTGFPAPGRRRRHASRGTAALATVSGLVAAGLCAAAGVFVLRMAPFADEVRAQTGRDHTMTYEQAGGRSGTPLGEDAETAIAPRVSPSSGVDGVPGLPGGKRTGTAGPGGQAGPAFASGLGDLSPYVPSYLPSPVREGGDVRGWSRGPSGGTAGQTRSPSEERTRSPGSGGRSSSPSPSDSSPSEPSPSGSTSSSPSPTDSTSPEPSPTRSSEPPPSESPPSSSSPSGSASPTSSGSSSPTSSGSTARSGHR